MACPTCDKTMQAMGCRVTDRPFFWCPSCGTTKTCEGDVAVPALVSFCRDFEREIVTTPAMDAYWNRAGVKDAINLPQDRRPT